MTAAPQWSPSTLPLPFVKQMWRKHLTQWCDLVERGDLDAAESALRIAESYAQAAREARS